MKIAATNPPPVADTHDDVGGRGLAGLAKKLWQHKGDTATAGFFLRNFTKPWIAPLAFKTADTGITATKLLFGASNMDDGSDAFRHAYSSALLMRGLREHGVDSINAGSLAFDLGAAHEIDTPNANSPRQLLASQMDRHNNNFGISLVSGWKDATKLPSDTELRDSVLTAARGGKLLVFDAKGDLRPSGTSDIPE